MYGGISIDWEKGNIELSNFLPKIRDDAISTVTVHFDPEWKKATPSPTMDPTVSPNINAPSSIVLSPIRTIPLTQKQIEFPGSTESPTDFTENGPWVRNLLNFDS